MSNIEYIAHRGAWNPNRRENSLGAIERARESGRFSRVELDVRRTRSDDDGTQHIVIMHDATMNRLYDTQRVPQKDQKQRDIDIQKVSFENLKAANLDIPSLQDAVGSAKGLPILFDIKDDDAVEPLLTFLSDVLSEEQRVNTILQSRNKAVLEHLHSLAPDMQLSYHYGWKELPGSLRGLDELNVTTISIKKWLLPIVGPMAISAGIKQRYVYTVNSRLGVFWCKLFKATGLHTDSVTLPEA